MEYGTGLFRIYRSGVPVACSHGGTLHYSDGDSHRPSAGNHHDGLVRRARSAGIGARWAGFSMGRFLNLFMLLTFAYVMVNYYDSSIPGLGFSIKGFIDGGTINLVNLIGSDGSTTMLNEIHAASSKTGPSMLNSMMSPYYAIVYFVVQFLLALLAAIVSAIRGLWRNCGNDHRITRADLYPVSCLRQARLAVLGMAQGVSRIQLLQGRRRSHA